MLLITLIKINAIIALLLLIAWAVFGSELAGIGVACAAISGIILSILAMITDE